MIIKSPTDTYTYIDIVKAFYEERVIVYEYSVAIHKVFNLDPQDAREKGSQHGALLDNLLISAKYTVTRLEPCLFEITLKTDTK